MCSCIHCQIDYSDGQKPDKWIPVFITAINVTLWTINEKHRSSINQIDQYNVIH